MILEDLYFEYYEKELGDFTDRDKERLREELPKVELHELKSIEDFKLYLELVRKFRQSGASSLRAALGFGFHEWLTNTLSVGEDGIYADGESKFLFELIQNVDDCDYDDSSNCVLEIEFSPSRNEITLFYNEKGFKPKDVFNITGIAERSKNLSVDKVEIGEKGIGFKSVFGIAEEVLIQSGNFSFALKKDNFTVPEIRYDEYKIVAGTKLTLILKQSDSGYSRVESIYRSLVERYKNESSLINKNPILFLNKLTKLKIFIDSFRSITFSVDRTAPIAIEEHIEFEESVTIKAELVDDGRSGAKYSREVKCYRYSSEVVFDRGACVARYGTTTAFPNKRMRFVILFPHASELEKLKNGSLYSFLPTQTVTTGPLIVHAPFKLAASRDYVDSQGSNKWFVDTVRGLTELILSAYKHLATLVREVITKYIPRGIIFDGNDKVDCLRIHDLSDNRILEEKLFVCADGEYRRAREVVALSTDERIDDVILAHSLSGIGQPLFKAENTAGLSSFGIQVHKGIKNKIFIRALEQEHVSKEAFDFLLKDGYKPGDDFLKGSVKNIKFIIETLANLSKYAIFKKAISDALIAIAKVSFDDLPRISIPTGAAELSTSNKEYINDALNSIEKQSRFKNYWTKIAGKCYCLTEIEDDFYFPTPDFLLVSSKSPLSSLSRIANAADSSRDLYISLRIRSVSEKLDRLCGDDAISNDDFFESLVDQRKLLKAAFGDGAYNAYIRIIQNAGADRNRFLKELIQNADDCEYSEGVLPQFILAIDGKTIVTECNENGFTKKNLRAITAIGESTKKQLFGNADTIGEKGIGFKSVFGIARSVIIRSCRDGERFDFSLSADTPTIPKKESSKGYERLSGTKMEFALAEDLPSAVISIDNVLNACRCLRKLKRIKIGAVEINIKDSDDGNERIITIQDGHLSPKHIRMRVVRHEFVVDDYDAIFERSDGNSIEIAKNQTICVYISEKLTDREREGSAYPLYSGLPTSETVTVPLYIDAPFDLVASRERIKKSEWNQIIAEEVLIAIGETLEVICRDERAGVLDYIPKDGEVFAGDLSEYFDLDFGQLLSRFKILPTLDGDHFTAPQTDGLVYYPYFVKLLLERIKIPEIELSKTLDFFKTDRTEKYLELLKFLGCKPVDDKSTLEIIEKYATQFLNDKNIRASVYSYLKNIPSNQARQSLLLNIKQLKIIPIKSKSNSSPPEFVAYSDNIFYGSNENTTNEVLILFSEWLTKDEFNTIYSAYIKEMNSAQRREMYEKRLSEVFSSQDSCEAYEWMLNEFINNGIQFEQGLGWLLQNRERIPLKTVSGEYRFAKCSFCDLSGSAYKSIQGDAIKDLLVDECGLALAKILQCSEVSKIDFNDIASVVDGELSREDIIDLQNDNIVPYYSMIAIISQCINSGYISEALAKEFKLEGFGGQETDTDAEFPTRPIKDIGHLIKFINEAWKNNRVDIVPRERTIKVKIRKYPDGREYELIDDEGRNSAKRRYEANDRGYCFCQMCQKAVPSKYIEVNYLEREPDYYWEQLKLSFCLNCSRDFEHHRDRRETCERFIAAVLEREIQTSESEPITIPIGDKFVAFTATHFAEVQQILKVMKGSKE